MFAGAEIHKVVKSVTVRYQSKTKASLLLDKSGVRLRLYLKIGLEKGAYCDILVTYSAILLTLVE